MSYEKLVKHFNVLVKGLKKALYGQRSEGSRFRTYLSSRDLFTVRAKGKVREGED
ncbi:MAG: hypothetical protein QW290_07090 [Sulfolobales archaeon]